MTDFELRNIPDLIFGRGGQLRCGQLMREIGGTKVLIHHAGEPFVLPLIETVKELLRQEGLDFLELDGVVPNPRLSKIREGIRLCREQGVDSVLAVGGGSVIDSAKGIAMGAVYNGDVWDFYCGRAVPQAILPLGVISTFAGTGSEFSRASVVTNEENGLKRSADDFDLMRPRFAILNPELTLTVPPMQTASGASDIMSHLCENYFTATKDVYLNHKLLAAGMHTVIKNAPIAVKEPDNYAARSALMIVAPFVISGLLRLGLVGDWACHLIEHEMSTEWDIPHGAGLAVITPVWMTYVYRQNVPLFAKFAVDAFGIEYDFEHPERTALEGIAALRAFFSSLGMPARISDFHKGNITDETLRKMAGRIPYYGSKNTIGETFLLTEEDVWQIYKAAM